MIKVYGSSMCPDCIMLKKNLENNNIDFEFIDINSNLKNLKEFLFIRDNNKDLFSSVLLNNQIGIPLIYDFTKYYLNWEKYLNSLGIIIVKEEIKNTCSINNKNC